MLYERLQAPLTAKALRKGKRRWRPRKGGAVKRLHDGGDG